MSLPFASTYTIRTYVVGYDSDGRATESGPSTATVQGVVTPLSDRELARLPEGMRAGARFRLRTQSNLGDLGDAGATSSKRIVVDGREYQIDNWGRWDPASFGSLAHNKYLASEVAS